MNANETKVTFNSSRVRRQSAPEIRMQICTELSTLVRKVVLQLKTAHLRTICFSKGLVNIYKEISEHFAYVQR